MNLPVMIRKLHAPIHASWQKFLTPDVLHDLNEIETQIETEGDYTPDTGRILHFLTLDLSSIQVVILGQDPYPQKGVATGRAFEVGTLTSWHEPFKNVSLKNIIRAIYHATENKYATYSEIKQRMGHSLFESTFTLAAPQQLFKNWEKQGVLMLNTAFTCRIGSPGSHSSLWASFTHQLLSYINKNNPSIIWFLWGNHAKAAVDDLQLTHTFESNHPMICKPGENDFLFGKRNAFRETAHLINWLGH